MGRDTILTKELIAEITKWLEIGNFTEDTFDGLGIAKSTWYSWKKQGEEAEVKFDKGEELTANEKLFLDFLDAIKKSRAIAVRNYVTQIAKASSDGSWQAAAWWLERTDFKKWGRKDKVGLSFDNPLELKHNVKGELREKLNVMAERLMSINEDVDKRGKPDNKDGEITEGNPGGNAGGDGGGGVN